MLTATGTGGIHAGGWGAAGVNYTYSTMGPANCWRGDVSLISNFLANQDALTKACTGSTKYYFNGNAGQACAPS